MTIDQTAFNAAVAEFTSFLQRFDESELHSLLKKTSWYKLRTILLRSVSDHEIIDEVEDRDLYDDVVNDSYSLIERALNSLSDEQLRDEIIARGAFFPEEGGNAFKIYRLYLTGRTEEAKLQALEYIRDLLDSTI